MNDEIENILEEIRDLQKEAIENQKTIKLILIFLIVFLGILLFNIFIK